MNGMLNPNQASKSLPISRTALEVVVLSIIGIAAILLRTKLRIPLNLPGHHGVEVMALLLIGRHWSKLPMATSVSTIAAALFMFVPWVGVKDPFLPLIYLLIGLTVDTLYRLKISENKLVISMMIIGSLSYAVIPLTRLVLHFLFNYPYVVFLKTGYAYPVLSHFVFGAAGGLLAALLIKGQQKILK
ncbi:MAG: hypothetical protein K9G61_11120 [Bacteroidales bacterium]|nr:hypothetical protein [Bacteroidales bacterium]